MDKYLPVSVKPIGYVLADPKVPEAVSRQVPFFQLYPNTPASLCLKRIAAFVIANRGSMARTSHVESLFLSPDTQPDENARPEAESPSSGIDPVGDIVRLLIKEGHVSQAQVQYAQKIQQRVETPRALLDILKELGNVHEEAIKQTIMKHRTGIRLGSLLVELGYISEKQLNAALNKQKADGHAHRLGEVLVDSHYLTAQDLARVLSLHLGYPYIEPELAMLDTERLNAAPREFFHQHHVLPLRNENGGLQFAMSDPLNHRDLEAVKQLFGPNIKLVIILDHFIHETLTAYEATSRSDSEAQVDQAGIMELIDKIIQAAGEKMASDIHIEPMRNRLRIRFRQDGQLFHYQDFPKDLEQVIINRIKGMSGVSVSEKSHHQEGQFWLSGPRFGGDLEVRVSVLATIVGEKVVMRLIHQGGDPLGLDRLGMGTAMRERFLEEGLTRPSGLVVLAGPKDSGKTSTMYAVIEHFNRPDTHIITVESPVERKIEGITQCNLKPDLGLSFRAISPHVRHQDPDMIFIAGTDDPQTAEDALQAARTGYRVMATMLAEDAVGAVLRLIHMPMDPYLLSSCLRVVLAQRLVRRLCPHCQTAAQPSPSDIKRWKNVASALEHHELRNGRGCENCNWTGYLGRVAVFELLVLNEPVRQAVLNQASAGEIRRIGLESGSLITLLEDGLVKTIHGMTSIEEVAGNLPHVEPPRSVDQINRLIGEVT